jgi:Zn-dependent metalloprotease
VKVGEAIGREKMGQIWYHALTDKLDSRAGFAGAARATLDSARDLYGQDSNEFSAVKDAWKAVGVNSRWKP